MPPEMVVVVVGTGTEVGKTWVAVQLLDRLGRQMPVAAAKPVQSFSPGDGPTDADLLARATGQAPTEVCPPGRSYGVAMAPPMAADALGREPFGLTELVEEIAWPDTARIGLVETAGGVRSPIAEDGDSADLARMLHPDLVVMVADAGLGTINAVRLSVPALRPLPVTVFLNRFEPDDPVHERNRRWLSERDGMEVVVGVEELADRIARGARTTRRKR